MAQTQLRALFYVDGFNLYHALHELNQPRLKWLSLHALAQKLIPSRSESLVGVVYFSAYASHRAAKNPAQFARHQTYVRALEATSVECVMGRFKMNPVRCFNCGSAWQKPEEKETDVAIATTWCATRSATGSTFAISCLAIPIWSPRSASYERSFQKKS